VDDNNRTNADDRRRLLHEMEVERNQLVRNIETCRIRDIDRPFIGEWSLKDIVGTWRAKVKSCRFERIARRQAPILLTSTRRPSTNGNQDYGAEVT
jgi:hypothetical protein